MKRYIRSDTSVLYEDDDVKIVNYLSDKVAVYQYADYDKPRSGNLTSGWLNVGIWKKYPDNLWYKWDTVTGGKLSDGASDFEEIADIVRADV